MEKNSKKILGIDPSINSSGVCLRDGSSYKYYLVSAKATKKLQKFVHQAFELLMYDHAEVKGKTSIGKEWAITDNIQAVCEAIEGIIIKDKPAYVVMEACAFAAGGRVADLSGLNHCIRQMVRRHNIPIYVVPPTTNKLEFTGNGQATKEMMVEVWKMCDPVANELLEVGKVDDLADACALCRFPEDKLVLE